MIADEIVSGNRREFTTATLDAMVDLVRKWSKHPFFVMFSRAVVRGTNTREAEARSVWAWTHKNIEWRGSPVDTQWLQDPFLTVVEAHSGDCAVQSILNGTMLMALGHPVSVAAVQWTDRDAYTHAVVIDHKTGQVVDSVSPVFQPWPPPGKLVKNVMEVEA